MRANTLLNAIETRMEDLSEFQEQLSTGKRINQPSDDPVGTNKALFYRHRVARNEQHQRNAEDGISFLSFTDTVLEGMNNVLESAYSDAVAGDNDSMTAEDRQVLANEVNVLLEDLLSKANTSFSGKFIFAGYNDKTLPFSAERDTEGFITSVSANPQGIDDKIEREIGLGIRESINIGGTELFQPEGASAQSDMFDMLIALRDGLADNDADIIGEQIARLQDAIDQVNFQRSTVGAKVNYFQRRLDEMQLAGTNLETSQSQAEDADYIAAAMNYQIQESAYTAALSASAQLIQTNLLNFLS
jgi:flagellar hook-associated protein 3 FlgL